MFILAPRSQTNAEPWATLKEGKRKRGRLGRKMLPSVQWKVIMKNNYIAYFYLHRKPREGFHIRREQWNFKNTLRTYPGCESVRTSLFCSFVFVALWISVLNAARFVKPNLPRAGWRDIYCSLFPTSAASRTRIWQATWLPRHSKHDEFPGHVRTDLLKYCTM